MRERATMRTGPLRSAASAACMFFRRSPTLPPSAIKTSAIALSFYHRGDVVDRRGDRRRGLLDSHAHALHARKVREQGVRDVRGGGLDQVKSLAAKSSVGDRDHLAIVDGRIQPVALHRVRRAALEIEIGRKALAEPRLLVGDAVLREQHEPRDFDRSLHQDAPLIAPAIFNACACAATSWTRMMETPASAPMIFAAIVAGSRSAGPLGTSLPMKDLRETPRRTEKPTPTISSSRARIARFCSSVFPKPMPGSSTMRFWRMPDAAARSIAFPKKLSISSTMSSAGSAFSRLCMMTTAALCAAPVAAIAGSRERPHTSFTILAPAASACSATFAL